MPLTVFVTPSPHPFPTRAPLPLLQAFLYTSLATAYFMINTLMPLVRPENYRAAHSSTGNLPGGVGRMAAAHKNYFVLAAGGLQFLVIWWLSRAIGAVGALPTAVTVAAKSVAGA